MDAAVPLTPSPLPGHGASALLAGRGIRRASPSLASSASSSFSAMGTSTVAGSIASGVDGTGQRQMLSDRYALGEELGRGAFGQVFKGMDTRSGEAVAIKQMCGLFTALHPYTLKQAGEGVGTVESHPTMCTACVPAQFHLPNMSHHTRARLLCMHFICSVRSTELTPYSRAMLKMDPASCCLRALGGIPPETLAAIMGEIELLRNLHHPNIVEYIGSFKTRSHLYIIMVRRPPDRPVIGASHSSLNAQLNMIPSHRPTLSRIAHRRRGSQIGMLLRRPAQVLRRAVLPGPAPLSKHTLLRITGVEHMPHWAQEYMENGALSTVIKPNKFGPFMEPLVSAIIAQVLRGLAYLHEQGVVHRDIKGANILTTKEVRHPGWLRHTDD